MEINFERFLEGKVEQDYINKLLDKERLTNSEKEIIKKLNKGMSLNDVLPKQVTITVYSLPRCGACHRLKEWLRSKNIPFKDIDVESNDDAAHYIMSKSRSNSFPQTEINGKIIVGFNPDEIMRYLGKY